METVRHINYKSDFVLREHFRNAQGNTVALPDVDFTLRYWVKTGRVYEASRVGGVYTNCVADGDALLVMFKEHNLGEGDLKHELRLTLDNALFADGKQNVYYPETLNIQLWHLKSDSDGVVECDAIAAYTRGYAFTYEDFTPEQLAALKGEPFRFEDFTPAQIVELKRPASEAAEKANKAAADAESATKECKAATEASNKAVANCQNATNNAQQATADAEAAAQRAEQELAQLAELTAMAKVAAANVPTALRLSYPAKVTLGNGTVQYVVAVVKPDYVKQNVLYLSDGVACDVEPSGAIVTKRAGISRVHVIPTAGTELYETISIQVENPALRMAGRAFRLDADGNIRLT